MAAEEDLEDEDWTKPVDSFEGRLDLVSSLSSTRTQQQVQQRSSSSTASSSIATKVNTYTCNQKHPTGKGHEVLSAASSLTGHEVMKVDHSRTIVHIDLDCFYAQVEMVRNPALRAKPLGIQQKYLLVTCNYVARSRGVTKLMRVSDALQRCPDLVIVSGEDLTHYREMSYRITELLHQFSPQVERLGFDENFVDVTHLITQRSQGYDQEADIIGHVYGEASTCTDLGASLTPPCTCGCHQRLLIGSHLAYEMREALKMQLGLTSCAGVAHNKLLAKLVGSVHKPNDQTTLFPNAAGTLMGSLIKVTQVPGIGHSTGKKLSSMGITTLSELIDAPFTLLKDEFGYQTAWTMQRLCQGHDDSPVVQSGPPQSISDEDSFKKCGTLQQAQLKMKELLTSLLQRLRKDGRQPLTLRLSVRKYSQAHKWTRESRQCGMPSGILHSLQSDEAAATSKLLDLCLGLFQKMVDTSKPFHLTLINVCFAKFQSPVATASDISKFFLPKSSKKREGDAAADGKVTTAVESCGSQSDILPYENANFAAGETEEVHKTSSTEKDARSDRLSGWSLNSPMERTSPRTHSLHQPTSSPQESRLKCTDNIKRPRNLECDDMDKGINVNMQSGANLKQINKSGLDTDVSPRKRFCFFAQKFDTGAASRTAVREDVNSMGGNEMDNQQASSSTGAEGEKLSINDDASETMTQNNEPTLAVPPNIDRSVFAELPKEVQQELLNEWKNTRANSESEANRVGEPHSTKLVELPGIDSSVFKELPPDIQDDVLKQYKHKRTSSEISPRKSVPVKRPRTVKTPSKKMVGKSKNIKDFFGKK